MLANALNTHIIVCEDASGEITSVVKNDADEANTLFEERCQLQQGATDMDSDSEQEDTQYRWVMWYAKGRLIKYRRLDH